MESPLLKVTVSLMKVTAIITERETGPTFEARIASASNQLVGNYGMIEHRACATQLRHARLNRVFELDGVNGQPRPEPIARMVKKRQASGMAIMLPSLKKTCTVKRRRKASSRAGTRPLTKRY
jgi:hypothetical protein